HRLSSRHGVGCRWSAKTGRATFAERKWLCPPWRTHGDDIRLDVSRMRRSRADPGRTRLRLHRLRDRVRRGGSVRPLSRLSKCFFPRSPSIGVSRLSSDWESTRLKIELSPVQIREAAYFETVSDANGRDGNADWI